MNLATLYHDGRTNQSEASLKEALAITISGWRAWNLPIFIAVLGATKSESGDWRSIKLPPGRPMRSMHSPRLVHPTRKSRPLLEKGQLGRTMSFMLRHAVALTRSQPGRQSMFDSTNKIAPMIARAAGAGPSA